MIPYIAKVYGPNAASALAALTFTRSMAGAAFPLFSSQMYRKLTPPGASGLLAGLSMLLIPAPVVIFRYGHKLRARSKLMVAVA